MHDSFIAHALGDGDHAIGFRAHNGVRVTPGLLAQVGDAVATLLNVLRLKGSLSLRVVINRCGCRRRESIEFESSIFIGSANQTPLLGNT